MQLDLECLSSRYVAFYHNIAFFQRPWQVRSASFNILVQDGTAEATEEEPEEDETARAFREAAEALREQREEAAMAVEDRISKCAVPCAVAE